MTGGRLITVIGAVVLTLAPAAPGAHAATPRSAPAGGDQLWAAREDQGFAANNDLALDVATSPDGGRVFVTGYHTPPSGCADVRTVAYDAATGAVAWRVDDSGPGANIDEGLAVAVSPDGTTVYVVGFVNTAARSDALTIAYDAVTGTEKWKDIFDGPGVSDEVVGSVVVSPDGTAVYVGGSRYVSASDHGFMAIRYDAATGARVWTTVFKPTVSQGTGTTAIALSPDGAMLFLTGTNQSDNVTQEWATAAIDPSTGHRLWVRLVTQPGRRTLPHALGVSPDGSLVYVAGETYGGVFRKQDDLVVAYDAATGEQAWRDRYGSPGGGMDDVAKGLAVTPDGSKLYVTGTSISPDFTSDVVTLAYDARTGAPLWLARFDGVDHGNDDGEDIVASPDGTQVLVAGVQDAVVNGDNLVLAYDTASGSKTWEARYDGPASGDDQAHAAALDPGGSRMFVTGFSTGSATGYDWATVALAT